VSTPGGDVTLVEGQTFCISDRGGDMWSSRPHGLFVLDTRVLSDLELRVNGHRLESVAVASPEPFGATFVGRPPPAAGQADADVVAFRRRFVGRGMRERVAITNYGTKPVELLIELTYGTDFADLFEVKEGRAHDGPVQPEALDGGSRTRFTDPRSGHGRRVGVDLSTPPDEAEPGRAQWRPTLDAGQTWDLCIQVTVEVDGRPIEPRFSCGAETEPSLPEERLASWRARLPKVRSDHPDLPACVNRSGEDLGALRIFDPAHPDVPIVAAGAPWFMTVFGRDSLLTAWMTMIADPSLACGIARILARFQGREDRDDNEEEPGKILHEMRFGTSAGLALDGGRCYYGSVDATPLFVMVVGELARWGVDGGLVRELRPHVDAALDWILTRGDVDGDGYVEYRRRSPLGLVNQGWKDSWDAIRFADGTLAEAPIALCEVQGYVYAAYRARAHFAKADGDAALASEWDDRADALRRRFNEDFWLDDQGTLALGLDADKRPVDAVTSNPAHCLWTGIVDAERAPQLADRLMADDQFSGWGLRTLATSMSGYNPVSYHNGSVWPHDNAIAAAGLMRYGFVDHAHRIIEGQLGAAARNGDRLPELFAGFSRHELDVPGAYPAACSPQAWAAASPLLWLRTLLRLDPSIPSGHIHLDPALPPSMERLTVEGVRFGDQLLDVRVEDGRSTATVTSGACQLHQEARPPVRSGP
jgi:glycogen debranching enzyme